VSEHSKTRLYAHSYSSTIPAAESGDKDGAWLGAERNPPDISAKADGPRE
jgi:hypothetical protein